MTMSAACFEKSQVIGTEVAELEKLSGINLPEPVKLYLACNPKGNELIGGSAHWRLFSLRELFQIVELRAVQGCRFCLAQMMGSLYSEKRGKPEIEDTSGGKHPVDHLVRTVTFAQGAGDLLYLNADDEFSVWVFYADVGFIEKLAPSLWEWIRTCQPRPFPGPPPAPIP
jgi:hypothetical protein